MSSTETAPDPEPAEPREAGVGLMFVIAAPPKKGWVVKTVIKQSPADLSVSLARSRALSSLSLSLSLSFFLLLHKHKIHTQGKIQEGHVLTDVNGKSVTDIKSLNALSKMLMGEYLLCTRTILLALSLFVFGTLKKPDGRKLAVFHIQVCGTFVCHNQKKRQGKISGWRQLHQFAVAAISLLLQLARTQVIDRRGRN